MAATRKLQGEIDRCLKKVTEGVETFEDIWQKVHNANNSNPKVLEKYESDLKKEIKKLQRLRDQIKSWIASAEIKDKSALLENRRLIETQMERFKVVERETKTKAYSKEGLGAAQKLDPAQRVKDEIRSWLTSSISSLQIQIDQYESEIESLLAGKKKRLDRDKQDRMDELRSKLDRHKFHVTKLETLLRLLDNDSVEADQIRKIKDDVEYYIESSQEPDFEENEFLYDDIIGLDEVELSGTGVPSSATTDSNNSNETAGSPSNSMLSGSSPVTSPIQLNCSSSTTNNNVSNIHNLNCSSDSTSVDITAADKRNKNETNASTKVKPMVKPTAVRAKDANSNTATSTSHTLTNSTASSVLIQQQSLQPSSKVIMSSTPSKPAAISLTSTSVSSALTNFTSSSNSAAAIQPATPFAAVAKSLFIPSESVASHVSTSNSVVTSSTTAALSRTSPTSTILASPGLLSPKHMNGPLMQQQNQQQPQQDASTLKTIAQEAINRSNNSNESVIPIPSSVSSAGGIPRVVQQQQLQQQQQPPSQQSQQQQQQQSQQHFSSTATSVAIVSVPSADSTVTISSSVTTNGPILSTGDQSSLSSSMKQPQQQQPATNEAHIPPLLGVAPLGPQPLQKEQQYQFQMMEASSHHLPQLSDSERLGTYYHRHPVQTPAHYPQTQPAHYDVVEFFQRLNTDTLFFVFYYMEGTKAQYLAAKALKKQSWRFHTKYYMWFQRHEEPKIINDDYEQGTYIYFDYEKWAQRKKEGFTFEYKYLEDKDLN